jgi:uncharacterized protein YkuJ
MGLSNPNAKQKTYLGVNNGKFVKRLRQIQEGCETRTNKNGDTVYEMTYKHLDDVFLKDAKVFEKDEYTNWNLTFEDRDGEYVLSLPYSSSMTRDFLLRLRNTDIGNQFTMKIFKFVDAESGKDKTRIVIYQNNEKILADWTDVPQAVEVKKRGKSTWDTSNQEEFIESVIINDIVPLIKNTPKPQPVVAEVDDEDTPDDDGDLPF